MKNLQVILLSNCCVLMYLIVPEARPPLYSDYSCESVSTCLYALQGVTGVARDLKNAEDNSFSHVNVFFTISC